MTTLFEAEAELVLLRAELAASEQRRVLARKTYDEMQAAFIAERDRLAAVVAGVREVLSSMPPEIHHSPERAGWEMLEELIWPLLSVRAVVGPTKEEQ